MTNRGDDEQGITKRRMTNKGDDERRAHELRRIKKHLPTATVSWEDVFRSLFLCGQGFRNAGVFL